MTVEHWRLPMGTLSEKATHNFNIGFFKIKYSDLGPVNKISELKLIQINQQYRPVLINQRYRPVPIMLLPI
jgi:hypothetical protein